MKYPLVSIVIATYNSAATLEKLLDSVKFQKYPRSKIEILVIDGGSRDATLAIARKYRCKILRNPKVDQVYAKYLGWKKARGKYLVFLDSDEAFVSSLSIKRKVLALEKNKNFKAVLSSGYQNLRDGFLLNNYINEFGDPFSFFMYRISKGEKYFSKDLHRLRRPFVEMTSMGVMFNREFVKLNFPEVFKKVFLHTHLFYLLGKRRVHFLKNDPIFHCPANSLVSYLRKINSRIKNNLFQTQMGFAGFTGREVYQPFWYKIKKFLFLPYIILILPVLFDSFYLVITRRNLAYLWHFPLSCYTLSALIYYYFLKAIGIRVKSKGYGT